MLDWRDRHLTHAPVALTRAWRDLRPMVEERLQLLPMNRTLLRADAALAADILPLVQDRLGVAAESVLNDARVEFETIGQVQMELASGGGRVDADTANGTALLDAAGSLGALVGGTALIAVVPASSITATAGLLGFGASAVVSWPVLLGGTAVAATALATGMMRTTTLKARRNAALLRRTDELVDRAIFSLDPAHGSLLHRLERALTDAARTALQTLE